MLHLTAEEVLHWNDLNASRWRAFFAEHPEALALPCDVYAGTSTVADLLRHNVAAELRMAQRLAGQPISHHSEIPKSSAEEIFAVHDRAFALLRQVAADDSIQWDEEIDLATRSLGTLFTTRKTVFFHAVLHPMRHYAQLATLLRHAGLATDWQHDYLFTNARFA